MVGRAGRIIQTIRKQREPNRCEIVACEVTREKEGERARKCERKSACILREREISRETVEGDN